MNYQGEIYYANVLTQETMWEMPEIYTRTPGNTQCRKYAKNTQNVQKESVTYREILANLANMSKSQ